MKRMLLLLLLCLMGATPAQSQSVFVNNRPFKGAVSGNAAEFRLEAQTLADTTSIGLSLVEGKVFVDGVEFASTLEDGKLMVDANALATQTGGRYIFNRELGSVDIYLVGNPPASTASNATATRAFPTKHFDDGGDSFKPSGSEVGLARNVENSITRLANAIASRNVQAMAPSLGLVMKRDSAPSKLVEKYGGKTATSLEVRWIKGSPALAYIHFPRHGRVTCLLTQDNNKNWVVYDLQF